MNRDEFLNELCKEGIIMYGVTWEENLKRIQELKKYEEYLGMEGGVMQYIVKTIKQKYFPEEVEKELIRKKLKGLLEVVDELKRLLNV